MSGRAPGPGCLVARGPGDDDDEVPIGDPDDGDFEDDDYDEDDDEEPLQV